MKKPMDPGEELVRKYLESTPVEYDYDRFKEWIWEEIEEEGRIPLFSEMNEAEADEFWESVFDAMRRARVIVKFR